MKQQCRETEDDRGPRFDWEAYWNGCLTTCQDLADECQMCQAECALATDDDEIGDEFDPGTPCDVADIPELPAEVRPFPSFLTFPPE